MHTCQGHTVSLYDLVWICGLTKIAKTAEVRCALDMITSGQLPCIVAITPHNPLHVCMHADGWMDAGRTYVHAYLRMYVDCILFLTPVWPITTVQSEIIAIGIEGGILCAHVILQSIDDLGCETAEASTWL